MERVIRAIHLQSGKISWQMIPAKIAATVLTIGTGGSAGNVGPCIQIGSGLASCIADVFQFNALDRKTLVICGLSAGVASILGTPLAGDFFWIEALFVGWLAYQVLFPSVVAALGGYLTAQFFGMPPMLFVASAFPVMNGTLLLLALVGGVVFGRCSLVFVECLNGVKRLIYCVACVSSTSRCDWRQSSARYRLACLAGSPGIGKRNDSTSLGRGHHRVGLDSGENTRHRFDPQYCGKRGLPYPSVLSGQPLDPPSVGS